MDAIALTQQLVQFDTRNPPGQEAACARFLADILRDAGFTVTPHDFAEGRTSLIARGRGRRTGRPSACRRTWTRSR